MTPAEILFIEAPNGSTTFLPTLNAIEEMHPGRIRSVRDNNTQ